MLKSLKGILVYVYFAMSPWNMIVLSLSHVVPTNFMSHDS